MEQQPDTVMDEQQAQQLLGTLSRHRDDIRAAYLHQYRSCALELTRADTRSEQEQLEFHLSQLRQAQSLLLGESLTTPVTDSEKVSTLHPVKQLPNILLSSTLVLLIALLAVSGSQLWSQSQHLQQLQLQLGDLKDQRQQLQQQQLALQQTLTHSLQQQNEERLRWTNINQQQQDQLQRQLSLIEQQQLASQQLQQSLARVDKQLYVERNQTLKLQQQIARLNQQSEVLIDELCADSATTSPAMDDEMFPAYMNRCRLLWSLASD
ncbi:hypothetical protein [Bacterioplanoides sp.]|uniref:hypothetical protein n=1 Tax=Bacterioplanoides sp. TaxID=2066072 RepID=UPI003B58CC3A